MASDPILDALGELETRLTSHIDGVLRRRLEELRLQMNGRFDSIEAGLDRLETGSLLGVVQRIETRLGG
ncbi:MAG TPA: hypothetical protein VMX54_08560 [Vicinamibacteria bacterium]|nr:hypothetical protein [Vicinamibacteria bacterium]